MSFSSCCAILIAPIWPIVSIVFGLIGGTISSTFTTLIVFFIALFHFPVHLWKTLTVAATTEKCFKGIQGNLIWRLPVLLLIPIGPILFLLAWTLISATLGTLWQIGSATGVVYDHDYEKASKKIRSNLRFEKDSKMRQFLDICQTVAKKDDFALVIVKSIKVLYTIVFAFGFACLAFIPFAVAMVAVTVFRLPINFFKTTKIALFTVMLRWDLRIIALLMLPLIHTVFPVVVLIVSMVGCFFWTWAQTQENLFQDKSPFREWDQLIGTVEDYYEEHKKFVSKRCDPFDHPTGIPMGWNGQQYGLEIERIVQFQLNFLLCVALLLYQTPIILVGSAVIVLAKYLPACIYFWAEYSTNCICDPESNCVVVLSVWPFHVLAVALIPLGSALCAAGFMIFALLEGYWHVVKLIFEAHAPICACLSVPFVQIRRCDVYTAKYYVVNEDLRLITKLCCPCSKRNRDEDEESSGRRRFSSSRGETLNADVYWDRFASQCIQSTSELLANGFLDYDSVEGMDPSCVQSIPSVAVFAILMDTLQKEGLKKGDIYWKVDETLCAQKGRAPLDNIAALVWPMVLDIQNFLKKHKKTLLKHNEDDQVTMAIQALLCDNHETDQSTEAIQKALDTTSKKQRALNTQIRNKISRLVLVILRVRPFQERMEKIFEYKYENPNKTMDDLEAQPLDGEKVADGSIDEAVAGRKGKEKGPSLFEKIFGRKADPNGEETEADPNGEGTEAEERPSRLFDRVFGRNKGETRREEIIEAGPTGEGAEVTENGPSLFDKIFGRN